MMTATTETERIDTLRAVVGKLNERDQSFARSMIDQFALRGYLSDKQWPWIEKLAAKALDPRVSEPHTIVESGVNSFPKIADLFAGAAKTEANPKGLMHPKVRFDLSGIDERWRGDLLLRRTGSNARYPGSINVTNGMPFGDPHGEFYGRIHKDGRFEPGRSCTDVVTGVLIAINSNPAKIAAAYGIKTGNCCFCSTPLSDERSTSVGYGPICAGRFALPWGETS